MGRSAQSTKSLPREVESRPSEGSLFLASHKPIPVAVSQVELPISALVDLGIPVTQKLFTLLSDHSAYLSERPDIQKELVEAFGQGEASIGRYTLSSILSFLDDILRSADPRPVIDERYTDVSSVDRAKLQALFSAINDYCRLEGLPDGQRELEKLQRHLCERDQIAPTHKLVLERGQLKILDEMQAEEQYGEPYFLFNLAQGTGYYTRSPEHHHISFTARIVTAHYDRFREAVESLKAFAEERVSSLVMGDRGVQHAVLQKLPCLPVDQKIGENLRLVQYADKARSFSSGSYREGDLLGYSSRWDDVKHETTARFSVAEVFDHYAITRQDYCGQGRGYNVDHLKRFTRPRTLGEAEAMETALKHLTPKSAELIREYRKYFTCGVGAYSSSLAQYNFFPWVFYNWDCSRSGVYGYTNFVRYDPSNIGTGLNWLSETCKALGKNCEPIRSVGERVDRYLASDAYRELKKALLGQTRERWSDDDNGYDSYSPFSSFGKRALDYGYGFERHSDLLRSEGKGPRLEAIYKVTKAHEKEVLALERTLRDFEYLLSWANFAAVSRVEKCVAAVGPGEHALALDNVRNLPLVLRAEHPIQPYDFEKKPKIEPKDPNVAVVPNSLAISIDEPLFVLTGANGAGKTHLLEALNAAAINAHRGLHVLAKTARTPVLSHHAYNVNGSVHSESGSAFQNEMDDTIPEIVRFGSIIPGARGLMTLDEFGRGTDARDGLPLLIGLAAYLAPRGHFLATSTHYTVVGDIDDVLQEFGIKLNLHTIDPETRKLVRGVGRSGGIRVAEQRGIPQEIIECAKAVARQADAERLVLPKSKVASPVQSGVPFFTEHEALELGIFEYRSGSSEWPTHKALGSATRFFAEHSAFRSDEYQSTGPRKRLPQLQPHAAEIFVERLIEPLTDEARAVRIKTFERLRENDAFTGLQNNLKDERAYSTQFCLHVARKKDNGVFANTDIGKIFKLDEREERQRAFERFRREIQEMPVLRALESLKALASSARRLQLAACEDSIAKIEKLFSSGFEEKALRFIDEHLLLAGKGEPEDFRLEHWERWVDLCASHRNALIDAWRGALDINFFATVAQATTRENMVRVDEQVKPLEIFVEGARNQGLRYTVEDPTPIDLRYSATRLINSINGTNGGGKSQSVVDLGRKLLEREQLGFVSAATARIGKVNFVLTQIASSKHTDAASSFQNECERIAEIIRRYEAMGCPQGGVVLLDEPFKGTSEQEAIPLLIGLMNYFRERNVQVLFTTHFSGVFNYLQRIEGGFDYRPQYVDYFTPGERFKLKEGIGASSGIRVAEERGMPAEIIAVARKVVRILEERDAFRPIRLESL